MRALFTLWLALCAAPLAADIVVAARNVAPGEVLATNDVLQIRGAVAGAFETPAPLIGREAKVALYAGRAILKSQIGTGAVIERNQIVELVYTAEGLSMMTEGRALGRGAAGQRIRVMNLVSKASLFGTIQSDGTVRVSK